MVGVGWAYICSSILVLVWPAHLNTSRTFVLSFLAFKSRNYTNVPLKGRFRVKAKGVIYERVHTDIGVYMRVHIIQRYDDTMKEKGEEEGERKYTSALSHEGTYTYVRAHPRENPHAHVLDAYGRARADTHEPWHT